MTRELAKSILELAKCVRDVDEKLNLIVSSQPEVYEKSKRRKFGYQPSIKKCIKKMERYLKDSEDEEDE